MAKSYDLSAEQRKLQELRYKRRVELRSLYWKEITNPHRHATGEGGSLFDPAMQRFQAMRASYSEYFKPTAKTFRAGMLMVVIPIVFAATIFKRERGGREKLYRSGEISYRDRPFKFI